MQGLAEIAERRGEQAEAGMLLDQAAILCQKYSAGLYLSQVLAKKEILRA